MALVFIGVVLVIFWLGDGSSLAHDYAEWGPQWARKWVGTLPSGKKKKKKKSSLLDSIMLGERK